MTLRHAAHTTTMQVMPTVTHSPAADRMMDEAAFQVFYQTTAPGLRSYIHRSAGSADVADDIVQDAFLRFLRAAPGGLDLPRQKAYLYKIASRLLVDHWRRVNRERRWDWKAFVGGQLASDSDVERRHDVSGAFRTLKPQQRSLLWLAYVEGFEHREIAPMLGLREKSVKVLLFRARRRMADALRKKDFDPKMSTAEESS
jgi:RNA polymerase sigma-70 factor (ECF subfamily)